GEGFFESSDSVIFRLHFGKNLPTSATIQYNHGETVTESDFAREKGLLRRRETPPAPCSASPPPAPRPKGRRDGAAALRRVWFRFLLPNGASDAPGSGRQFPSGGRAARRQDRPSVQFPARSGRSCLPSSRIPRSRSHAPWNGGGGPRPARAAISCGSHTSGPSSTYRRPAPRSADHKATARGWCRRRKRAHRHKGDGPPS